ncbi:HEAT repeat domain-containing protein [Aeromonas hydrophila]|uniref:hypothetical protein n=1 Tax=Aeromonas hydrophila TaxID=644 RepID=UPI002B4A4D9A|nr:hypothetical protein [Aeromonas hydrophila]
MTNKERLVQSLLNGVQHGNTDVKCAALLAIGESGLIDEHQLVNALEDSSKLGNTDVKSAALAGMGRMLRNSDHQ